jgi:hypothetical protein
MKTKAIFFIMLLNSFNSFSQWVETGNSLLPGDFFGTINNYAIFTKTNGNNRMKLNHNVLYSVNAGTSVNRTGNLLIGRENNSMIHPYNLYHSSLGAFSLLHLNGDGSQVQEYGYRNWMQTGITFTGNRDLSYFGLRKLSTDDEDFTETTLTWSDNVPGDDGADDFAIRFTSGDDNGTAASVSVKT